MLRATAIAFVAFASIPAHATYIYELTGHIDRIGDAAFVPDVLHVGDAFHATFEYFSTPGAQGGDIGGRCTDAAALKSKFDFAHIAITSG
jgi:hypothetical protein